MPKARDAKGPDSMREDLGHVVTLLKTPTSNLGSNGGSQHPDKRRGGGHGPNLQDEVEHLLPMPDAQVQDPSAVPATAATARTASEQPSLLFPTPKASDGTKGGPHQRGSKGDLTLPSAAAQLLLPTPRASDSGTPRRRAGEGFRPPLSQVVLPMWTQDPGTEPDPEDDRTGGVRTRRRYTGGRNAPDRPRRPPTRAAVSHRRSLSGSWAWTTAG